MGKGLALQFKNAFPANFKAYSKACKDGDVRLGRVFIFDNGQLIRPRWILNNEGPLASALSSLECVSRPR